MQVNLAQNVCMKAFMVAAISSLSVSVKVDLSS